MAIVTIARECGSINPDREQEFSTGVHGILLHKEMMERRFREKGLDPKKLERYDERQPGFFASIFSGSCDRFLHAMKGIILGEISHGPCLVVGRGAHVMLRDLPNCLRVRFVAPFALRVQRIQEWRDCSEREAEKIVRESDENRSGFCRFHFDSDWADVSNYDLVINTEKIDVPSSVDIIEKALALRRSPENEQSADKILKDMIKAHEITEEIIIRRNFSVQFFEAKVNGDFVTLFGATSSARICNEIGDIVANMDGIEEVENRIQIVGPSIPRHMSM